MSEILNRARQAKPRTKPEPVRRFPKIKPKPDNDNVPGKPRPSPKILPFPTKPRERPVITPDPDPIRRAKPRPKQVPFGKRVPREKPGTFGRPNPWRRFRPSPWDIALEFGPDVLNWWLPKGEPGFPHPSEIEGVESWAYCNPGLDHDAGVQNACGSALQYPRVTGIDYDSAHCGSLFQWQLMPYEPGRTSATMHGSYYTEWLGVCEERDWYDLPAYYRIFNPAGLPNIVPTQRREIQSIPTEQVIAPPAARESYYGKPEPRVEPSPWPKGGLSVGLTEGFPAQPLPKHRPKRPKGPEVKRRVTDSASYRAFRVIQDIFHNITEVQDVVDSLFEALPAELQKGVKTPQGKIMAILNNIESLDWGAALYNLAYNHIEDKVAGRFFAKLKNAARDLGINGSYKFYQPPFTRY